MAKKKSETTVQCNPRLTQSTFKKLQAYADDDGIKAGTMARILIEEAIRTREESQEEMVLRLLTHFDEKMANRITILNHNLRQAVGMLLTPKPKPSKKPDPDRVINSEADARKWVQALMEEIPE